LFIFTLCSLSMNIDFEWTRFLKRCSYSGLPGRGWKWSQSCWFWFHIGWNGKLVGVSGREGWRIRSFEKQNPPRFGDTAKWLESGWFDVFLVLRGSSGLIYMVDYVYYGILVRISPRHISVFWSKAIALIPQSGSAFCLRQIFWQQRARSLKGTKSAIWQIIDFLEGQKSGFSEGKSAFWELTMPIFEPFSREFWRSYGLMFLC